MKLGTLVRITDINDVREKFAAVKNLGMSSCQLVYKPEIYSARDADIIRQAALDEGIEISAQFCGFRDSFALWDTHFDFVTSGINSPIFALPRIEYLISAIPFLCRLGITDMIIHPGFIPNDPFEAAYSRMVSVTAMLGNKLKTAGLNLLFETGAESPISLLRLIKDTGCGNLFVNLDTGNLIMYGYGNPVDAMTTFGKYVRNTHFKDGLPPTEPGKLGRETKIGEGNVDFPKVVSLLKASGYDRFITIEREISGNEQTRDIIYAKEYIEKLLSECNFRK